MPEPVSSTTGSELKDAASDDPSEGEVVVKEESEESVKIVETKPVVVDIMRCEPFITNLIVDSYVGDKNEQEFFHGIGTAYFQGGHVYTGEFVDGFMHGTGKYEWSNGTLYEGDFDRNRVSGNGKYTWCDGSTYEGAVLNGLRHGVGTYRCGNIPSVYSGEWCHGERTGKGVIYYDDAGQSFYEGSWFNNKRHGYGLRRYKNGNVYEGDWVDNIRHGNGKMNWFDRAEMYEGQWFSGVQHGMGQHSWFMKRKPGSQYPVRNVYNGEWVNGKRHGYGTFCYANGAQYTGDWCMNRKQGHGKYTFKNGMVYEGEFEEDHMVEYPELVPSGMTTPDITAAGIPVRPQTPVQRPQTPLQRPQTPILRSQTPVLINELAEGSGSGVGLPVDISINHLLDERDLELDEREEEIQQVGHIILRYVSKLKQIYNFYSHMGANSSLDNTFAMTKFQFWRLLKDCRIHHYGVTLTEIDFVTNTDRNTSAIHDPEQKVLMKDFLNAIVAIAHHLFADEYTGEGAVIPWCLSKLMSENILPFACQVITSFLHDSQRAIESFGYINQCLDIFKFCCRKSTSFKMRQFLFLISDCKLINDVLTSKDVINILAKDNPEVVQDEFINLELEMTFLEFFEALVYCATVYVTDAIMQDPTTPRPSSVISSHSSAHSYASGTSGKGDDDTAETEADPEQTSLFAQTPGLSQEKTQCAEVESPDKSRSHTNIESPTKIHDSHRLSVQGSNTDLENQGSGEEVLKPPSSGHVLTEPSGTMTSRQSLSQPGFPVSGGDGGVGDLPSQASFHPTTAGGAEGTTLMEALLEVDGTQSQSGIPDEFQYWAMQLNIFFNRKFFPAAEKLRVLALESAKKAQVQSENPVQAEEELAKQ